MRAWTPDKPVCNRFLTITLAVGHSCATSSLLPPAGGNICNQMTVFNQNTVFNQMTAFNQLRFGFVGLALVLAATLAWNLARRDAPMNNAMNNAPMNNSGFARTALPARPAPPANALARERAAIVSQLGEAQDYSEFARKYAANYPADWSAMIDRLAQRRVSGGNSDGPDAWFAEALRDLRRTRGITAARASPIALSRIIETQSATLAALSVLDHRLCVDFLLGQSSRGFFEFAARHPGLMARMAAAAIDAIADGQSSNIARTPPSDNDFELLESALVTNGLNRTEVEALLDGRHPDPPIPDARLCEAGIIYLDTLKQMPDETRLRLYALAVELMAKL